MRWYLDFAAGITTVLGFTMAFLCFVCVVLITIAGMVKLHRGIAFDHGGYLKACRTLLLTGASCLVGTIGLLVMLARVPL